MWHVNKKTLLPLIALMSLGRLAVASDPGSGAAAPQTCNGQPGRPLARTVVTAHSISVAGKTIAYDATAGTLLLHGDDGRPIATMSYVAYVRTHLPEAQSARPIVFAFNGGPLAATMLLHMAAFGPRRVVLDNATEPRPPFHLVDNPLTLLDRADLVFIDPVGTGLGRGVCGHRDTDFWGVDPDIDSFARFITQYLSDNARWSSPKYLLGESYGTTRAAALVNYLLVHRSVTFNGVIMASMATDIEELFTQLALNDRPYPLYLPSFAATAWYHHALPVQPPALQPFLDEVRDFAMGPYLIALFKGDRLSAAEKTAVAQKIHEYTGLPTQYVLDADLRITEHAFQHELLQARGETIGRSDSRVVGPTLDPLSEDAQISSEWAVVMPGVTAAFHDYLRNELRFDTQQTWIEGAEQAFPLWNWTHKPAAGGAQQPVVNSDVDLGQALVQDPNLRVLVLSSYFDLSTPFFAVEYFLSHLGIPDSIRPHVRIDYFESGHMIYVDPQAARKMTADIDTFIEQTSH